MLAKARGRFHRKSARRTNQFVLAAHFLRPGLPSPKPRQLSFASSTHDPEKSRAYEKREAERRKAQSSRWPRVCKQVYAVCATHLLRGSALLRGALAFRRSHRGTRHAGRNQHWLSSGPCFPGLELAPVPVKRAPRGPVLVPVERGPKPPGNGMQGRARAPHPAPCSGVPREHDPY